MLETKAPPPEDPDDTDRAMGRQIRDLRKAKRMTITELADRIDRSVGYVSQIERGLSAVTIAVLQEVATALDVKVSWFFQGEGRPHSEEQDFIVRRADRRRLELRGSGVIEELLSPNLSGQIEMILTRFEPGGRTGEGGRLRGGEEAGVVLSGTLDITVDGKVHRLRDGDSFTFRTPGGHDCFNPGDTDAVVLWVHAPPSY